MRIEQITIGELRPLVELSYRNDRELFEKYHIRPMSYQDCVASTMEMMEEMNELVRMSFFEVRFRNKRIGYIAIFEQFLYSYAIALKYRQPQILAEWWAEVRKIMGPVFKTALYENNHRAIAFLINNGMRPVGKEGTVITFINN